MRQATCLFWVFLFVFDGHLTFISDNPDASHGKGENMDTLLPTAELINGEDIHFEGQEAAKQGDPLCLGMGMANKPSGLCPSSRGGLDGMPMSPDTGHLFLNLEKITVIKWCSLKIQTKEIPRTIIENVNIILAQGH